MNKQPNVFNQAYHYTQALSRWLKMGRPVRSEEEIMKILETYCKPCEAYEKGGCQSCGCRVNLATTAPLNKIAMATEKCPLGKWGENEKLKNESTP